MAQDPSDFASLQNNGHSDGLEVTKEVSLQDHFATLMRGKWIVLLVTVFVTGSTAIFTYITKPVYEATSTVLIDMKATAGNIPFLDFTGTAATNKITNELETLKSRTVAKGVARSLISRVYVDDSMKQRIQIIRDLKA